jgi:glucose-6-phosphate 1-dehydrogenase
MAKGVNNSDASALVIFGVSGDLARRKVLPAIYHLFKDSLLHEKTIVVGTSRRELSVEDLLKQVELCVLENDNVCDPAVLQAMRERFTIVQLNPTKGSDYEALHAKLQEIEDTQGVCLNRLFYLSIPPGVYPAVVKHLGEHRLNGSCSHNRAQSRLLVEKPFGYDYASAKELIESTNRSFSEEQIFRIDHYLAKETVQNILAFRKHNAVFKSIWNAKNISRIDIAAFEKIGIEGRSEFYEQIGALRDLVQSHLLQLLALTTMDMPRDITSSQEIHKAKQALLEAVEPVPADEVRERTIRAQYRSYKNEVSNPTTTVETFAALEIAIASSVWKGTTIRLATGKGLSEKRTAITITFGQADDANHLTFRLQPNEGIDVELLVKKPGFAHALQAATMDFRYADTFMSSNHPDAYERVLVDAVRGDRTLFATAEEVLASWHILQPVLDEWSKYSDDLKTYEQGSTAESLLESS